VNKLKWAIAAVSFLVAPGVFGAELSPRDFAYGTPIRTQGEAAAYRFALPVEVYQRIVRHDLSDLRVFNAQGEIAPLRVTLPSATQPEQARAQAVPLFPLRGTSPAALGTLRVTIGGRGSTLRVQTEGAHAGDSGTLRYVLDGRSVDKPVTAIVVQWPNGAGDFAGKLMIEAGDTLGAWRTVMEAAPIANLHANGQQLVEQRVSFPAVHAKFWRLSWVGTAAPFDLSGASVESAATGTEPVYSRLVVAGNAVAGHPGEYEFDLGAQAPIERINLDLPVLNSVVGAEVLSRRSVKDPWRSLRRSVFYRLNGVGGELRNGPLEVPVSSDRYWLVRLSPADNGIGKGILRMETQWRAHELTFLARGGGPYELAFGSGAVVDAGTVFDSLPTGTSILEATLGATQVLGGPQRLQPPPAPFPWKSTLLWAILGLSILMLAAMAYRLSRNVGRPAG
jgi:hypothetical protein